MPAGDIGVGGREIGYMFGQYKRINNRFCGVLTGKGLSYGGSLIRPEATGYGAVCARKCSPPATIAASARSPRIPVGNIRPVHGREAVGVRHRPITLSDSEGTIVDMDGIDAEKLAWVMDLKNVRRGRIREYAQALQRHTFLPGQRPWKIKCNLALPSTQNEISAADAKALVENGCICVAKGTTCPPCRKA